MAGNPFRSQCLGHRPYRFLVKHWPRFSPAIDRLMTVPRTRRAGVRVLYISPLKALAADVAKNLEQPLRALLHNARRKGCPCRRSRSPPRSGDTTAQERRRIASHPPDILVTTPESLYLLLTSKAGRILGNCRYGDRR